MKGEAFERDLPVPFGVVYPHRTLVESHGGDERPAIRRHGDALFPRRSRGDLVGLGERPVRGEALPPYMETVARHGVEKHPLAIGRPGGKPTGARRAHWPARR